MATVKNYTFSVPFSEFVYGHIRCYIPAKSYEEALKKLQYNEWVELAMEWDDAEAYTTEPEDATLVDASCATCGEVFQPHDIDLICNTCEGLQDPETTTPDEMYG